MPRMSRPVPRMRAPGTARDRAASGGDGASCAPLLRAQREEDAILVRAGARGPRERAMHQPQVRGEPAEAPAEAESQIVGARDAHVRLVLLAQSKTERPWIALVVVGEPELPLPLA